MKASRNFATLRRVRSHLGTKQARALPSSGESALRVDRCVGPAPAAGPGSGSGLVGNRQPPARVGSGRVTEGHGSGRDESMSFEGDYALRMYLRDAAVSSLLSQNEEVELAARVQAGDDEARERMIRSNLRLVVKIARDFEGLGMPLLDLINEGNMGLMRAVERFDPAKGAKLSTYAAWWIRQAVKRALANQGRTIRLPVHLVDVVAKIRRCVARLTEELGREPSDGEVGEMVGLSSRRVAELLNASCRTASLDAPIVGTEDSTPLSEVICDEEMSTSYEQLEEKTTHAMIREFVGQLDRREAMIIRHRFGLDGSRERTLEEVGAHFGVTRERVRQIQNTALRKLRKLVERRERTRELSLGLNLLAAA